VRRDGTIETSSNEYAVRARFPSEISISTTINSFYPESNLEHQRHPKHHVDGFLAAQR
jgi:hypothetical protein